MKKGFLLYNDFYPAIKDLCNDDKAQLLDAIFKYSNNEEVGELTVGAKISFGFIKQSLDRDSDKYESICVKNKENVEKRWSKYNHTSVYERIRPITKHTNIDNDTNNDTNKDKEIISISKKKIKTYTSENLTAQQIADRLLTLFNEENGTKYTNTKVFLDNLIYWLDIHEPNKIAEAIQSIKFNSFWKNKMTPEILFRRSSKGSPVDWIETLLNSKEDKNGRSR